MKISLRHVCGILTIVCIVWSVAQTSGLGAITLGVLFAGLGLLF